MPEWVQISIRTLAAIVVMFLMTKLLGKRQISQLSLFEYVTGISIGNIAAYISLDLEKTWYLGIISLFVWVSFSVGIELLTMKSKTARDIIDGKGTVLIEDGQLLKDKLRKERLTLDELLEQLRKRNVFRVADVEFAVMESSGELNVQLKRQYQPISPDMLGWTMSKSDPPRTIIMDGDLIQSELSLSGHDEEWLKHVLRRHNLKQADVLLWQLNHDGSMMIHTMDGRSITGEHQSHSKEKVKRLTSGLREEFRRMELMARNESDRKMYQSAQFHLQQSLDAMGLKQEMAMNHRESE
ncbi:DUF421 domain-containing protein [Paenibacillus nanensis]|uniref:DUF421 domain-containing protein n=1 Tax=Paenibacillus nanensis TaxID=393251 RepID=A0A3A1USE3_9BACL|nr:DUF421 domain-containing protein [Paenibacillus nanensis]RIX50726.1 DUF421 domain-containing protein [Paenibacillus nanensis]